MSHEIPIAVADLRALTDDLGPRLLDVPAGTPPGPRAEIARQNTHLHGLATRSGEKCRLTIFLVALMGLLACEGPAADPDSNVPVRVGAVAVDEHDLPVVVLEEEGGPRWLPIWIGTAEARSIAVEMERQSAARPNTHDLAKRLIAGLEGELVRVVVTELRSGTYFATIALRSPGGTVDIDARPSDAIAIALRTDAPIFVRESLLDGNRSEPATTRPERRI